MKRCLLLGLAIAILSMPSVAIACNCQLTRAQRAQRYLAYKAYKEKIALEQQQLRAEQQLAQRRELEARREETRKNRDNVRSVPTKAQSKGK